MNPSLVFKGVRPHHAVMFLVFAVALGAASSMLPGQSERIAMLERDGHSREALEILENAYAGGDRRYRTLQQMLALYEDQGNAGKAREIYEALIAQRPRDSALRDRLAKFYRAAGDSSGRIEALKAQINVKYSEAACHDLIAAVRLEGRPGEEIEAIQRCRQRGYRRADDLLRLAALSGASGDTASAIQIMRSIDDVRRLKEPVERYQLLSLLLEQNQPREAERRAVRWIKASKDQNLAVGLIDAFARSKYPDSALEVAKDAGSAGDQISLTVAERLLEQSQPQVAQLYLRGWLDNALFENEEVVKRFVEAALLAQDLKIALQGARKFGLSRLPAEAARDLANALQAASMNKEAAEVLAVLPPVSAAQAQQNASDGLPAAPAGEREISSEGKPRPLQYVAVEQSDPLGPWRRSLTNRMTDDAIRRAGSLGRPVPRHFRAQGEAKSHTKVLNKTTKVLQRTKKLKSLRLKQKLVRESARAKAK